MVTIHKTETGQISKMHQFLGIICSKRLIYSVYLMDGGFFALLLLLLVGVGVAVVAVVVVAVANAPVELIVVFPDSVI